MRWLATVALCCTLAMPGAAQDAERAQVLIIDTDRLYLETLYGRRIEADLGRQVAEWQAENDRIAETLRQEERSLTLRRPEMTPKAFRAEAEAFDAKVQEVRRARDAKNVEFQTLAANARAEFADRVESIIAEVMFERGASVVIEDRNVVLSARAAKITDDLIVRVDAQLGDGTQ